MLCAPQIGQMYESLYNSEVGGFGVLARVANTPAAMSAWEAYETDRYGYPATIKPLPGLDDGADAHDDYMWVIQDPLPYVAAYSGVVLGARLTAATKSRDAVEALMASLPYPIGPGAPIPLNGHHVGVTGFEHLTGYNLAAGMFTPLYKSEGVNATTMVFSVTSFDAFMARVHNISEGAVMVISDHVGGMISNGECDFADTDQILSQVIQITDTVKWLVQGTCALCENEWLGLITCGCCGGREDRLVHALV